VEDETPNMIAKKLGVPVEELLRLNKPVYRGLRSRSKLKKGTTVTLPWPQNQPAADNSARVGGSKMASTGSYEADATVKAVTTLGRCPRCQAKSQGRKYTGPHKRDWDCDLTSADAAVKMKVKDAVFVSE
jgi:hypothetical protein